MDRDKLLSKDNELREFIKLNPRSATAWAYRLGKKDAIIQMQEHIKQLKEIK